MTERPAASTQLELPTGLALSRAATRLAMIIERGWPLVLPFVILASLFASVSWFGLFGRLPDLPRLTVLAVFCVLALVALYPLRRFRLPSAAEVDRRIESANKLLHSPVLVQTDRPSGNASGFAHALWQEHQKRMAAKLGRLGADLPSARVADRDPWGMRALAALVLAIAFAFSFGPLGGSLGDGFQPQASAEAIPPRIDAWVTPPAYTGKAPIFLTADANQATATFTVPQNSDLSLRVTGGSGSETLVYLPADGAALNITPSGPDGAALDAEQQSGSSAMQFASKLVGDGHLVLKSGEQDIGQWAFAVTPDKPPSIRFASEPKRAANGALELQYQIEDDYGAASAKSEFELAEAPAPGARPLYGAPEMPLSLPRRGSKANAAKTTKDLTEHVWAGAQIKLALVATDGADQIGRSATKTMMMPERSFTNPLARAVIEQRRLLGLDANAKRHVLDLMDAITLRPEDTFDNMAQYLAIMSARTRLEMAGSDDQLREVVSYLWEVALGIEEGDLSAAEKRMRQAQQALQEALKNGASDEEIEKLMQELRQAMNDFLREFAERNQQNQNSAQMPQNGQELRQSDLDRMMDQIENLAKSGNRDRAQELLSQLQDMMNNLQAGKQGQQGQQDSDLRQQMDKLGEIMRRQQEMMNETFRMDQMQRGDNGDGQMGEGEQEQQQGEGQQGQQGQQGQGQGRPMTPEEFAEALKQLQEGQGKLQGDLQQLGKDLEGMGMEPNQGFGQAGRSMGDAQQSLGQGEGERAVGHQGRALEALRQGAKEMMQQLQAMQGDQGGSEEGGRQQNADRDPLGRPRATQGPDFGDSVKVPDEIDVQRARQILEAIRKRLGNALSPDVERSYLERLLELK